MSISVENFLASYHPAVRALAFDLRALIMSVEPAALEHTNPGATNTIRYGLSSKTVDQVCSIGPSENSVSLIFTYGTDLPDTQGILTGTGKRARSVKIAVGDKPDLLYFRYLLEVAFAQAHGRHETHPVKRDEPQ